LEEAAATRKPAPERKRKLDEAVVYATAHRIRIEALSIMNDAKASPNEIAVVLGEDLSAVSHHIRELYGDGSIESAGTTKRRNATEHFYRAVTLPYVTSDEYGGMSPNERREIAGLIVQAIMAETLAALRVGKMEREREPWLTWQAVPVDEEGEQEVAELMQETYDKVDDIKARNANRLVAARAKAQKEGEEPLPVGTTEIIALMSFERSRAGRPDLGYPPLSVDLAVKYHALK
jgi:DNA-binding transcriptional ArsR family regulator